MDDFILVDENIELEYYLENLPEKKILKSSKIINFKCETLVDVIYSFLLKMNQVCFKTLDQVNIQAEVYRKTRKHIGDKKLTLGELESISNSYISQKNILLLFNGLLTFGGLALIKIPVLLTGICRLLIILCWIFDVEPTDEMIIKLLVSSTDDLPKESLGECVNHSLVYESARQLAYRLALYFSFDWIPIIGSITSIGTNFYFVRTVLSNALDYLKRDWMTRKYGKDLKNIS